MYSPFNAVYSRDGGLCTLRKGDLTPFELIIAGLEPQPVRVAYAAPDVQAIRMSLHDLPWKKVAERTGNRQTYRALNSLVRAKFETAGDVMAFFLDLMPGYLTRHGRPFYHDGAKHVAIRGFDVKSYELTRSVVKELGLELPDYATACEEHGIRLAPPRYKRYTPHRRRSRMTAIKARA